MQEAEGRNDSVDRARVCRRARVPAYRLPPAPIYCPLTRRSKWGEMKSSDLIKETVSTYEKHGWQLRRVLLRPETIAELRADPGYDSLPQSTAQAKEALMDALWFSRASHERREAWELRLLAETPFALFETFEEDENEDQREEMRSEIEARLRDHVNK